VRGREAGEREQVLRGVAQHGLDLDRLTAKHPSDHPELFTNVRGIGLGEDRADRRRDHLRGAFRDLGQHVAQEMEL